MNLKVISTILIWIVSGAAHLQAQGPPITADKPIMLGSGSVIIKTLTEIHSTDVGTFTKVPLMIHYLPTSNSLIAVHIPYVTSSTDEAGRTSGIGDINLLAKYQFHRRDGKGKTFRMVLKTLQNLPTGPKLLRREVSSGSYHGYYGIVAGYESIKYGISNEFGYRMNPGNNLDAMIYKFGVGLPLLKPTYPVKQVNLFFEYSNEWGLERDSYELLYAQGVQYAKGRLTLEAAVQLPLVQQNIAQPTALNYNILLGTRYVF